MSINFLLSKILLYDHLNILLQQFCLYFGCCLVVLLQKYSDVDRVFINCLDKFTRSVEPLKYCGRIPPDGADAFIAQSEDISGTPCSNTATLSGRAMKALPDF